MKTRALALAAAAAVAVAARTARAQDQVPNPHVNLRDLACTACHTTNNWRHVAFDHSRTTAPLRGQHAAVPCTGCHDLRDFRTVALECRFCHQDPHRGDAGTRCQMCHVESSWRQVSAQDAHAGTRLPELGVHAALQCADCHRQAAVQQFSGPVTRCVECHQAAFNSTTNPSHAALGFSQQCEACHQFTTWSFALFQQHDAIFGIYSGPHAGVWRDCATCHTNRAAYTAFTCVPCHGQSRTDVGHQGVAGYSYQSAACLACHPAGRSASFGQHDAFFPIFTGAHAARWAACADCHTNPADRRVYSCMSAGCHPQPATDPAHAGIPGYRYAAIQCLSCHPTGQAGTFTQHDQLFFPIYSGTHAARWSACAACHPTPGQPAVFTCMSSGCHPQASTDPGHAGIPGYGYAALQCLGCHATGQAGAFNQHDAIFPIFTGSHAGTWAACASCHPTAGQPAVYTCMSSGCHPQPVTDPAHAGIPSYQYTAAQCYACHPTGQRGQFTQHDQLFFPVYAGTHAGTWSACAACHPTPGQPAIYTCMSSGCHPQPVTDPAHAGIPSYQYTATQCYACHPTGQRGQFTQHDALFFPIYSGRHLNLWSACTQCHPTAGQPAVFTCMSSGCHPQVNTTSNHSGVNGYQYTAQACYSCHPTGTNN